MKKLVVLLLLASGFTTYSQDWPLKKMVAEKKLNQIAFVRLPAFSFTGSKKMLNQGSYQELRLNSAFSQRLLQERPAAIQVSIPLSNSENLTCELVRVDLGNIKFTRDDKEEIQNIKIPVLYRGIVVGEGLKNDVMLTVNEDYLSFVATLSDKAIQVTKTEETNKSSYRLYNSKKVQFPVVPLECGTKTAGITPVLATAPLNSFANKAAANPPKCVNVFVDCFDSLWQWNNSNEQQTINYVYELFNSVATCFANEQITIQISAINVWTRADPYRGDTRENALADLAANYKDNFYGNICVGLDYSISAPIGRSGIASSIGRAKGLLPGICPSYTVDDNPFCYNDLNYPGIATQNFPTGPNTTGAAVYLVTHEIGHLLGARHTKWCGWKLTSNPDTYGALDSCGGMEAINNTTPVCNPGPPPPASGATIMSYCVGNTTASDFVNFRNGFGLLPGNAIRNFVDTMACLPSCLTCLTLLKAHVQQTLAYHFKSPFRGTKNENNPVFTTGFKPAGLKQPDRGGHLYHFQK